MPWFASWWPDNGSNVQPAYVERLLLPLRVVVVITAGLATLFAVPHTKVHWLLIIAAALYNVGVAVLLRRRQVTYAFTFISPLVNGLLAVIGLWTTGGLNSPYQHGLTLIITAVALRQPPLAAFITTLFLLFSFATGIAVTPAFQAGADLTGRLIIFCLFNFLVAFMIIVFTHTQRSLQLKAVQMTAHELRNPLAGVRGILSLLRRRFGETDPKDVNVRFLEMAEQEVERLGRLVTKLSG